MDANLLLCLAFLWRCLRSFVVIWIALPFLCDSSCLHHFSTRNVTYVSQLWWSGGVRRRKSYLDHERQSGSTHAQRAARQDCPRCYGEQANLSRHWRLNGRIFPVTQTTSQEASCIQEYGMLDGSPFDVGYVCFRCNPRHCVVVVST